MPCDQVRTTTLDPGRVPADIVRAALADTTEYLGAPRYDGTTRQVICRPEYAPAIRRAIARATVTQVARQYGWTARPKTATAGTLQRR